MVISHTVRTILPGLAIFNLCLADEPGLAEGFRSELWRMEYREQDKDEKSEQPDADEEDSGRIVDMDPERQRVEEEMVAAAVANNSLQISTPGQVDLKELRAETPFADWKIDEDAAGSDQYRKFYSASAWQLSRAGGGRSAGAQLSKGPSAVTFLVAIVACIVVTGALFSGRE